MIDEWDADTEPDIDPLPEMSDTHAWATLFQEVRSSNWRVESSSGVHMSNMSQARAIKEFMNQCNRGCQVDLYSPEGKWIATSNGHGKPHRAPR